MSGSRWSRNEKHDHNIEPSWHKNQRNIPISLSGTTRQCTQCPTITDTTADPAYTGPEGSEFPGPRSLVYVALAHDGILIGHVLVFIHELSVLVSRPGNSEMQGRGLPLPGKRGEQKTQLGQGGRPGREGIVVS